MTAAWLAHGDVEADVNEVSNCLQLATVFDDYALVYAGTEILGHQLRGCRRTNSPDRYAPDGTRYRVATDFFTFAYGKCEIPEGRSACPIPAAIIIHPDCGLAGAALDTLAVKADLEVRDARAVARDDGALEIITPGYRIEVYSPGSTRDERLGNALEIAGSLVGIGPASTPAMTDGAPLSDLPPPPACS
jgi:hypothetical protein